MSLRIKIISVIMVRFFTDSACFTDMYVGYHMDQYHAHKNIISVFPFSVNALIIKFLGIRNPINSRALFSSQMNYNVT